MTNPASRAALARTRTAIGAPACLTIVTLAASAVIAVVHFDAAPAASRPGPAAAAVITARGIDRDAPPSLVGRVRAAIVWLDRTSTVKGAYFWPGVSDICGLPRR